MQKDQASTAHWAFFKERLLDWYQPDRRPMPWKEQKDPYLIWLSEIILQQTRVEQGLSYYKKFSKYYPTVHDLADAPDQEVMKHWEGLGYYSRARNLLKAARMVSREFGGQFPNTSEALLKLPGVGPYTAAAIASFAFNEPIPVLDGNVYRILSRYAADETPIDTSVGKQRFIELAHLAFAGQQPARYNQAIMDFGALVCKPKKANCSECYLADACLARASDSVYELPVKAKKLKKRTRYFHFLVLRDEKKRYLIQQRTDSDIWRDLFQFVLLEAPRAGDRIEELIKNQEAAITQFLAKGNLERSYPPRKQQLTHQTIIGNFHEMTITSRSNPFENSEWVDEEELQKRAFPKMITSFIGDKSLFLDLFSS